MRLKVFKCFKEIEEMLYMFWWGYFWFESPSAELGQRPWMHLPCDRSRRAHMSVTCMCKHIALTVCTKMLSEIELLIAFSTSKRGMKDVCWEKHVKELIMYQYCFGENKKGAIATQVPLYTFCKFLWVWNHIFKGYETIYGFTTS